MLIVYIYFVYWKWKERNCDSGKSIFLKKLYSVEIVDYVFCIMEQ